MIDNVANVLANYMLLTTAKALPVQMFRQLIQQADKLTDGMGVFFNKAVCHSVHPFSVDLQREPTGALQGVMWT